MDEAERGEMEDTGKEEDSENNTTTDGDSIKVEGIQSAMRVLTFIAIL